MEKVSGLLIAGPSKQGKSTRLLSLLAPYRASLGGYYVQRHLHEGRCVAYALCGVDQGDFTSDTVWRGLASHAFLTWQGEKRVFDLKVFDEYGAAILRRAATKQLVLLDEIGGVELLSDRFFAALCDLFMGGTPVIGVWKSEAALQRMQDDVDGAEECGKRRLQLLKQVIHVAPVQITDGTGEDIRRQVQAFLGAIFREDGE